MERSDIKGWSQPSRSPQEASSRDEAALKVEYGGTAVNHAGNGRVRKEGDIKKTPLTGVSRALEKSGSYLLFQLVGQYHRRDCV